MIPGSAEWLMARKVGIGASEAAAVLGLSRYKTPLDVYIEKTKDAPAATPDSQPMKRGRRLEPIVLDMYEEDHGAIQRLLPQITSAKHPFMFASLDARRADDLRPVEAKTAGRYVTREWGDEGADDVPQEYLIQITHQMIVAEATHGDIAALLTLDDFRKYTIALDPELAEMVVEGLRNFWQRVENREPPAPTTGAEAEKLYRKSVEQGAIADQATIAIYHQLLQTRAALKPLEKREAQLIDSIKLFLGDKDALIIDSVPAVTWRSSKPSLRFNEERFKADHPSLHDAYREEKEGSRRFIIKEQ